MMKAHCDNCDALIVGDLTASRRLTVQPWGYQCDVTVTIRKPAGPSKFGDDQVLCASCLHTAALAFADSLKPALVGWSDTREKSG